MRLDSPAFLAVFAAFFLVYAVVPSRAKRLLLVLGNVVFYATLSRAFVPLLLALGVVTYFAGARIHAETSPRRRDAILWIAVIVNVVVLLLCRGAALGVSFFTLQAISYVVDAHRRVYEPPKSVLAFL